MTNDQRAAIPVFTMADRLRKARELTGLDQGQFAEKAGMSRTTVVNYEHGHRLPRGLYIRSWAAVTGVPVEWLESGEACTCDLLPLDWQQSA